MHFKPYTLVGLLLLNGIFLGAKPAWATEAQQGPWSFLTTPDTGREISIGGYGGTMGSGLRLEFDLSKQLAPLSLTLTKRNITLQAETGEALDSSRKVLALAYTPRLFSQQRMIGENTAVAIGLAMPVGLTLGKNRNVTTQVTEFIAGPFPGTGENVTRNIIMRGEDRGAQIGVFVGIQPAASFVFSSRYSLTIGADLAAGVPFSKTVQARKDVTRAGAFINFGMHI